MSCRTVIPVLEMLRREDHHRYQGRPSYLVIHLKNKQTARTVKRKEEIKKKRKENRCFSQEDVQVTNIHMKRHSYSLSLAPRKIQIKIIIQGGGCRSIDSLPCTCETQGLIPSKAQPRHGGTHADNPSAQKWRQGSVRCPRSSLIL